ncbi:hypothetical protein E1193_00420 [Micromonospora sp. KC606]|uniref:hypothetical protein n=1 Tax=Micromonospora sp. KC606 TaxID=2530379 RepID=UPI0010DB634D|nr:hypothetical protein [Micromonospora sp. KC606]TDC86165.1 hypothetical protein E1193_00420 [Micromonospora sp. KC606]
MLRYAASLAIARPARRSVPVGTLLTGAWRVARLVLVAPLIAMALLVASFVAMNLIIGPLEYVLPFEMDLQLPLATLFTLGAAVLLARLGRRWTAAGAPTMLLFAVTVPGFAFGVLAHAVFSSTDKVMRHAPAYAVFFLGLGAVLVAVARLARAGRGRAAWWTGILGAIFIADIAVMLPVLNANVSPEEAPHLASAPVWLFTALTDSGFGLPSPTGMQIFIIGDIVELDPFLYLVFAALALGAVTAGSRQAVPADREVAAPAGAETNGSPSITPRWPK